LASETALSWQPLPVSHLSVQQKVKVPAREREREIDRESERESKRRTQHSLARFIDFPFSQHGRQLHMRRPSTRQLNVASFVVSVAVAATLGVISAASFFIFWRISGD